MSPYHYCTSYFKQKKQTHLIAVVPFLSFLWLGLFAHAREIQKITTPHFTILCDTRTVRLAARISNTLETIYKPVSKTLGVYPSPIRLWINADSCVSNGYFTSMPRHIYFYTLYHSDPNFIGNVDWLDMLCLHEFRHAVQHSIEYHSTPFWLRPLYFGGNLVSVCSVSSFFKEGDAVGIETALSKSGRGRLPGWEKLYKVNLLERGAASFARQLFGSLKYEIPDEYHIGYYFTTHIRRKYGADAIKSIFEKSVRGIPFFGFYNAIKKVTKRSILKVYQDMNQELLLSWQKQVEGLKITPATQLTIKKPNDSIDYTNPFMDASGTLMAWKTGIGLRAQLVQVRIPPADPTTLKKKASSFQKDKILLYFINNLPPAAFSIGEGCAAWLEECQHSWQKDKEGIRLQYFDFKQRKRRTLVANSRYTALAISPNTHQLIAVESDTTGNHFLVLLDTKSGKVLKKLDNPDNGYYLTPSWAGEDHVIVVKTKDQKNSILRIHVATSKAEILLPYTYEHRSCPRLYKDYLLYNSAYNGIDNIYAMHLPTKACSQVTSRKYGAYLGMVDPITNQLIFNDYTKNGMDIAVMPFDPLLWTPLGAVEDRSVRYYDPLVVQEQNSNILTKVPNHLYPLTNRRFAKDYFGFMGTNVIPYWEDRGLQIEFFKLVTLQKGLEVTPYWHQNFDTPNEVRDSRYLTTEIGCKVKYTTFYPILEIDIKGTRYKQYEGCELYEGYELNAMRYEGNVWLLFPSKPSRIRTFWIPALDLSIKFPYYFTLDSSKGAAYLEATMKFSKKDDCGTKYCLNINNFSTASKRDIHPPWSQELHIAQELNPPENSPGYKCKYITSLVFSFFFPGIGNHHYCSVSPTFKRLTTLENSAYWTRSLKLVYGLPLAYPECGIPLIWFLKKIWIEGYYDAKGSSIHQPNTTAPPNNKALTDAIGTTLFLSNGILSNNRDMPCNISLDFPFFTKPSNSDRWSFQFPVPTIRIMMRPLQ